MNGWTKARKTLGWGSWLLAASIQSSLSAPLEGDYYRLESGMQVHRNCVYRDTPPQESLERISRTVNTMVSRSNECFARYRIPEANEVPRILSRVRLHCEDTGGSRALGFAQNFSIAQMATAISHGPLELTSRAGIYSPADLLFHEILHFLPTNNRSDHNQGQPYFEHGDFSNPSEVEDQVFFITGICFPHGLSPYWNAESLETRCEQALTQRRWGADLHLLELINTGRPLWQPHSLGDARATCRLIQQDAMNWQYLAGERNQLLQRLQSWMSHLEGQHNLPTLAEGRTIFLRIQQSLFSNSSEFALQPALLRQTTRALDEWHRSLPQPLDRYSDLREGLRIFQALISEPRFRFFVSDFDRDSVRSEGGVDR